MEIVLHICEHVRISKDKFLVIPQFSVKFFI